MVGSMPPTMGVTKGAGKRCKYRILQKNYGKKFAKNSEKNSKKQRAFVKRNEIFSAFFDNLLYLSIYFRNKNVLYYP